nr:hypothetical protein [Amylibacter sp.]
MKNIKLISTENLSKLVAETEATLEELKDEVERRVESQQHDDVSHLEHHFKSAELSLQSIKDFMTYLLEDIRSKRH